MPLIVEALIMLVASYVLASVFAPHTSTESQKPASLSDFDFPQIEEGTPQAVYFGECWSKDWMVLAYGNYYYTEIMSEAGGKK